MTSLRQRKREQTRRSLVEISRRLFREKGYDKTTLEEICDLASIHVTTFFKYFSSKEELAFAQTILNLERFKEGLASPDRKADVLSFWWTFLDEVGSHSREEETEFVVALEQTPALASRFSIIIKQYEDLIAEALAVEAGEDPEHDLYSRAKAATLLAVHINSARWAHTEFGHVARASAASRLVMRRFPKRKDFEQALAQAAEAELD